MFWTIIIVFTVSILIAIPIAIITGKPIKRCLELKELEEDVRLGKVVFQDISDGDLFDLQHSMYTVVGMGGVGPYYIPSFDIICITQTETKRRREKRIA